jgi:O-glycosyl hydrolase
MKKLIFVFTFIWSLIFFSASLAQEGSSEAILTSVDFSKKLRTWDGFGVNYVELAQSPNYDEWQQEYGGFSLLSEEKRQEILDKIFNEDGLKPAIVKMFFDPFHQKKPGAKFDHEKTTKWMRYFVREGLKRNRNRGADLEIITTLYGPPPWATKQKIMRGRDLDPSQYQNLAKYLTDWIKFLKEKEKFPVKYLSLHNEGDSPNRWPLDGSHGNIGSGHDYNAYWRPWQVAEFITLLRPMMNDAGLEDVGITPGETTTWGHFARHWYHWAIHDNPKAMNGLGLITSHGFGSSDLIVSDAPDLLRLKNPDLHAWTTSMSWGKMDIFSLDMMRLNIYKAKVNAIIPWACIQTLTWVGGDPNPGTAFRISTDGDYEVLAGYYFYKQLSRAGQPGMAVSPVLTTRDSNIDLVAFTSNGTKNPDAFIVLNKSRQTKKVVVEIKGGDSESFIAFQTTRLLKDKYKNIGIFKTNNGVIRFDIPERSVITFFGE